MNRYLDGKRAMLHQFYTFILWIIDSIDERFPGRIFCILIDNLNAHKNLMVWMLIVNRGHQLVFCAPYCATNGSI